MQGNLCEILPAFVHLECLHIKFRLQYTPLSALSDLLDGHDICLIGSHIQRACVDRVVQAAPSLRWLALEVYDLSLECWEISRGSGDQQGGPVSTKAVGEHVARALLKREGMDAFQDVRPSLE